MSEITNDRMYELQKRIHMDVSCLRESQNDLRQDMLSARNERHLPQGDFNIRGPIGRIENRLGRIENRLERRELAEAQSRFEPHP